MEASPNQTFSHKAWKKVLPYAICFLLPAILVSSRRKGVGEKRGERREERGRCCSRWSVKCIHEVDVGEYCLVKPTLRSLLFALAVTVPVLACQLKYYSVPNLSDFVILSSSQFAVCRLYFNTYTRRPLLF